MNTDMSPSIKLLGDGIRAIYKYTIPDFGMGFNAARFDVDFPDDMTVKQFIDSVVENTKSEFGDFSILYGGFPILIPYRFGSLCLSYEYMDESQRKIIDIVLNSKISKAWVCNSLDLSQYYIIPKMGDDNNAIP